MKPAHIGQLFSGRRAILLTVMLLLAGCMAPVPPTLAERGYPPDFALVFTVEPVEGAEDLEPLHEPAQHVVLPDRTFRVALGRGAEHDFHPQITDRLSPDQMVELYRLAEAGLLLEPPPPGHEPAPSDVYYHLAITAHGYRRRYLTTPADRPAATILLRRLIEMREDK